MISLFNLEPIELYLRSIERKLDRLMEHAAIGADSLHGVSLPGLSREASGEIMGLVREGEKIRAIKEYRVATGASLRAAKSFIDSL